MPATASRPLVRSEVEALVRQVVREKMGGRAQPPRGEPATFRASSGGPPNPLVVNVSARHMHVTQADLETLFGRGASLTKLKDLYQQREFASEQTVTIVGPRQRVIPNVRILGPCRAASQIELSYTDGIYLGLDLPLRISGNIEGTPGATILGPAGALQLSKGVIRARRHVHMSIADMEHFRVKDGDEMKLQIDGPCGVTFHGLVVRHHPKVVLEVHIDTDEGNACDIESAARMELLR